MIRRADFSRRSVSLYGFFRSLSTGRCELKKLFLPLVRIRA